MVRGCTGLAVDAIDRRALRVVEKRVHERPVALHETSRVQSVRSAEEPRPIGTERGESRPTAAGAGWGARRLVRGEGRGVSN